MFFKINLDKSQGDYKWIKIYACWSSSNNSWTMEFHFWNVAIFFGNLHIGGKCKNHNDKISHNLKYKIWHN
jgi:hypothetical protein